MKLTYCPQCGEKAVRKVIGDEGEMQYCPKCEKPLWDTFSTCVICAVVNEYNEVALLKQSYVSNTGYVCVAGYMKPGETAEATAKREIEEETGLKVKKLSLIKSYFYEGKDMLMLGFMAEVNKAEFRLSGEVDEAEWFDLFSADSKLREGGIAWQLVRTVAEKKRLEKLTTVYPTKNQLKWQEMEFTAFFHYGVNSFTDREWGDGSEDEQLFNPKALNTDQWCAAIKDAGVKGCIITAKHHDGFCLWNTKYTDHSVMTSPLKRDIVEELSKSCKKYGIKLGVYLSPWDRHEATYGSGKAYDDYFCNQLTELCSNYGELYTVWFDGACGEGPNGKKQQYDWNRYYSVIRRLQPSAVISVSGPDVRWCGNEAGDCRESEWSVVPARLFSQKAIAAASQQADNEAFRAKKIDEQDRDLGSREAVEGETDFIWYPAEVDTSIRPGWFHHDSEDSRVRPLDELTDIYVKAVGGNSVLLLNIPPHRDGYLTKSDTDRLHEIGEFIRNNFTEEINTSLCISSHAGEITHTFTLQSPENIGYLMTGEDITKGQRVESFRIEVDGNTVYTGTTIGYKKLVKLNMRCNERVSVIYTGYRAEPVIRETKLYKC